MDKSVISTTHFEFIYCQNRQYSLWTLNEMPRSESKFLFVTHSAHVAKWFTSVPQKKTGITALLSPFLSVWTFDKQYAWAWINSVQQMSGAPRKVTSLTFALCISHFLFTLTRRCLKFAFSFCLSLFFCCHKMYHDMPALTLSPSIRIFLISLGLHG